MRQILVLFCAVFLAEIATDIYVPVLPLFESIFGASINQIQLTMSLHLLGFALAQPIYGIVSDYYGRRPVLLFGFTVFLLATLLCALSECIQFLIVARFLQGVGACVAPVLGMAIIKDYYSGATSTVKMLSLMSMTVSLSPIIGPILGTFSAEYFGWYGCFMLLFGLGLFLLPLLFLLLKDSCMGKQKEFTHATPSISKFVGLNVINAVSVSCVWVFITAAPFIIMQKFKVQLLHYGYYQAFTVVAYMAGGALANRLIEKMGSIRLMTIGIWILTIGAFSLFIMVYCCKTTAYNFVCCMGVINCGIGIFRPPLLNRVMDFYPKKTGFAVGVVGTSEMAISAFAIACLGVFHLDLLSIVSYLFLCSSIIALSIFYILKPKDTMGVVADF